MTVCIAAHAFAHRATADSHKIVLCFDSLVGHPQGVVEAIFKCDWQFAHGLAVLFAGPIPDAQDLISLYKERLGSSKPTRATIKNLLWEGMAEFSAGLAKRGVAEHGVQLLIAGFIERKPVILYVEQDNIGESVMWQAIGTGADAAESMLRWREITQHTFLNEAIYALYEAKRFAEKSPYVGEMTTIFVLDRDTDGGIRPRTVTTRGRQYLEDQFGRLGPQAMPPILEFPKDGLA